MFADILAGLAQCMMPETLFWISAGTILGLVLGLIPGLGSLIGMALCLPFVFRMEPLQAMPFLVALSAVGFTGGSITSVLLGVPGEAANIVTTFDGYPMTRKGQGAQAIGAALTSSLVGGVLAAFFALLMMFAIMPIVMSITSREMVFIILVGLSFICLLGKGDKIKNLVSGCFGILLSSIGLVSMTGEARFTFDNPFLFEGLSIIPITLGLFAVPPLVDLAMQGGGSTISHVKTAITIRDTLRGAVDVFHHKWLCLKCSVIGYFFGIMPGIGAQAAVFVAYGHARSTSEHPEQFGTGIIEGVIAPESCNNAKESGSWLTTIALGIPGSATGALGLGALVMLGIMPGPNMLKENLDLTITIIATLAISNLLAFVCCFPVVPYLARVSLIPGRILVPLVLVVVLTGAYASRGMFEDVWVLLIFSALGLVLNKFKFNVGSLLLGFLLGRLFETYLFLSIQIGGIGFFLHPAPLGIAAASILFFLIPSMKKALLKKKGSATC